MNRRNALKVAAASAVGLVIQPSQGVGATRKPVVGKRNLAVFRIPTEEWRDFERDRIWKSLADDEAIRQLRSNHQREIQRLCQLLATSEKRLYDGRAKTLKQVHPLGIQVNLETGVANGVLVVRSVPECATVLRKVLTNSLEFDLEDNKSDKMWYLRERVSGSVFRVVTKDRKLTNCFWNFYRHR